MFHQEWEKAVKQIFVLSSCHKLSQKLSLSECYLIMNHVYCKLALALLHITFRKWINFMVGYTFRRIYCRRLNQKHSIFPMNILVCYSKVQFWKFWCAIVKIFITSKDIQTVRIGTKSNLNLFSSSCYPIKFGFLIQFREQLVWVRYPNSVIGRNKLDSDQVYLGQKIYSHLNYPNQPKTFDLTIQINHL